MIEQETVLALIEAKEYLEAATGIIRKLRADQSHVDAAAKRQYGIPVLIRIDHAVGLIESILAKGR